MVMLDRNFLHELTAYLTWAKVGERAIFNEVAWWLIGRVSRLEIEG